MEILFLTCAIFAGTVLAAQFLLGFGSHGGADGEAYDDGDGYADADGGASDGDHDAASSHDAADHGDSDNAKTGPTHHADTHHTSTWLFGVLTFRTILIGLTFFGLTGKAALASGFAQPWPLVIAVGAGLAAMYGVFFLMRGLYRLTADGTERISRAVGEEGMVYLTIPAHNSGVGKIHVVLQNRLIECEAMTAGDKLPTGTPVVVVGVLSTDRVIVESAIETAETARNSHA